MHVHEVSLTDEEKRIYNDIVMYGRFAVRVVQSMVLEGGDRREATNHIFEIILRLQQAVVSPTMCMETMRKTRSRIFSDALTDASNAPDDDCPICMETMTNPSTTKCNHWFCSTCIATTCGCKMACPICRAPIEIGDIVQSIDTTDPRSQGMPLSTKFSKVVELVHQIPDKKVIIFTHWRQEQRELYDEITRSGRPARIISGTTSMEERHAIVHDFNEGTDPMVLIANIKTTSMGLNLQAAQSAIFPSLDWSPCLELQAIARVHRIGVNHPVDVHRITAPGSIDDRVQNRQLEKLSYASQLLNDKRIESRLSIDSSYGDFLGSIFTLIQ